MTFRRLYYTYVPRPIRAWMVKPVPYGYRYRLRRWLWRMAIRHVKPRGEPGYACHVEALIQACRDLQNEPRFKGALSVPSQLEWMLVEELHALGKGPPP